MVYRFGIRRRGIHHEVFTYGRDTSTLGQNNWFTTNNQLGLLDSHSHYYSLVMDQPAQLKILPRPRGPHRTLTLPSTAGWR